MFYEFKLKHIAHKGISDSHLSLLILAQCIIFIIDTKIVSNEWISITQFTIDLIFVIDLIIKIKVFGVEYWKSPINIIDTLVVVISMSCYFSMSPNAQSYTVLRVIRLMRMFRILRLIPNIDHITIGVKRALKASRGVFLMLTVLISFFSMLGFLLFSQSLPEYFSDPIAASYTVFSLFTVEGWNEVPSAIESNTLDYYLVRAYVITVIIFGSFFALSIANAIFIDEMVMDNNDELEKRIDSLTKAIYQQNQVIKELKDSLDEKIN